MTTPSRVANQQLPDCGWFGLLHHLHQVIPNRPDGCAWPTDPGVLQPLSCPARTGTVVTSFPSLPFLPTCSVCVLAFPSHVHATPCRAAWWNSPDTRPDTRLVKGLACTASPRPIPTGRNSRDLRVQDFLNLAAEGQNLPCHQGRIRSGTA